MDTELNVLRHVETTGRNTLQHGHPPTPPALCLTDGGVVVGEGGCGVKEGRW